jgi:hypothetical protein
MPPDVVPFQESRVNPVNPPLQGDFSQLGLPEILDYLKTTSKTGVLVVRNGNMTKTLHFKEGVVVFATSNISEERFGDMLLREGKISKEQLEQASLKVSRGRRLGRILVEMKALTPKDLWSEVRRQVAEMAYGVLQWDSGFFQFLEGEERTGENITTAISVPELLLEGLRRIEDPGLFERRIPSRDVVFERVLPAHRPQGLHFEEYEKHVFKLVNGTRSVEEICDLSEVGEFETLKTLYIFFCIGFLHVRRRKDRYAEEHREGQELRDVVKSYNEMFSFVFHYLLREVGPIAENILDKYLGKLKTTNPEIFSRVALRSNGTLSDDRIMENVKAIPHQRNMALIQALNEYLYSALLAVRRTLGLEHERKVLETLRSTRKDLFREGA